MFLNHLLSGKIVTKCVKDLIINKPTAITIDGACMIILVCGKVLDAMFTEEMTNIFTELIKLSKSVLLDRKSKFKLMDMIDMRNRKWELRESQKLKSIVPKKLDEIRKEDDVCIAIPKVTINANNCHKQPTMNQQKSSSQQIYVPSAGAWKRNSSRATK